MSKPVALKDRQRCRGCRQFKGWFDFSKEGYCPKCASIERKTRG